MSRSNSLSNSTEDVVVHTQVYRSRRRSGSGSKPSSRKNSLSDGKSYHDGYQPYDSQSYWHEQAPVGNRRRRKSGTPSYSRQSLENGGEPISRNENRRDSGSMQFRRRKSSGSQPSSRRNSRGAPVRDTVPQGSTSRKNSASEANYEYEDRTRRGSASRMAHRKPSSGADFSDGSLEPQSSDFLYSGGRASRGRTRYRKSKRTNSLDSSKSYQQQWQTNSSDAFGDTQAIQSTRGLSFSGHCQPSLKQESHTEADCTRYGYEVTTDSQSIEDLNNLSHANETKDLNVQSGYDRELHNYIPNRKSTRRRSGPESDNWRRDCVSTSYNNIDSTKRTITKTASEEKELPAKQQERLESTEVVKVPVSNEVLDHKLSGSNAVTFTEHGASLEASAGSDPSQDSDSLTPYHDACKSNALESFIYSAVKQLLIPKLGSKRPDVINNNNESEKANCAFVYSLPQSLSEHVNVPNSLRRSQSYDGSLSYTVPEAFDSTLARYMPVVSQPAPNVNSLSLQCVCRHASAEKMIEGGPNPQSALISAHKPYLLNNNSAEGMHLFNGVPYTMSNVSPAAFNSNNKSFSPQQSWPPLNNKYSVCITPQQNYCAEKSEKTEPKSYLSTYNNNRSDQWSKPLPTITVPDKRSEVLRREATEHCEPYDSDREEETTKWNMINNVPAAEVSVTEAGRYATEHCELETPVPAPVSLRRRQRPRRRRAYSRDYSLDPQYFSGLNRTAMLDETDCPLDSLDLESNDWKECVEKCIQNISDGSLSSVEHPGSGTSSGLSWGEEMEKSDEMKPEKVTGFDGSAKSEDEKLHEKFSAIRERLISPPVESTVSVISHHPSRQPRVPVSVISHHPSKQPLALQVPEIRIDPPPDESASDLMPRVRRQRSRNYSGDGELSRFLYENQNSNLPNVKLNRSHSITTGAPTSYPPCGCSVTRPHTHEVARFRRRRSESGGVSIATEPPEQSQPITDSNLTHAVNGSTDHKECVQEPQKTDTESVSKFQPRVLRPRRRRTRSQDLGLANHQSLADLPNTNSPQIVRSGSVCDFRDTAKGHDLFLESGSKTVQSAADLSPDSIDARFERLLDMYIYGSHNSLPSGKIIHRRVSKGRNMHETSGTNAAYMD